MTKKYNNPVLQVVGISKKDIIATSLVRGADVNSGVNDAPGRRNVFDEWYEGY